MFLRRCDLPKYPGTSRQKRVRQPKTSWSFLKKVAMLRTSELKAAMQRKGKTPHCLAEVRTDS